MSKSKARTKRDRSIAAKKGWKTRRERALPAQVRRAELLVDNAQRALGKKPRARPDRRRREANPRISESSRETIRRLRRELRMAVSDAKALQETAHFTPIREPKYLHADGTLAVMPSSLRHMSETKELRRALKKKVEEYGGTDTANFDDYARMVADFYEAEVVEVYTLFFSP